MNNEIDISPALELLDSLEGNPAAISAIRTTLKLMRSSMQSEALVKDVLESKVLSKTVQVIDLEADIESLKKILANRANNLNELEAEIENKDAVIAQLEADLVELRNLLKIDGDQHASHIKAITKEHEQRIGRYYKEIETLRSLLNDAARVLEWGEPHPKPVLQRIKDHLGSFLEDLTSRSSAEDVMDTVQMARGSYPDHIIQFMAKQIFQAECINLNLSDIIQPWENQDSTFQKPFLDRAKVALDAINLARQSELISKIDDLEPDYKSPSPGH